MLGEAEETFSLARQGGLRAVKWRPDRLSFGRSSHACLQRRLGQCFHRGEWKNCVSNSGVSGNTRQCGQMGEHAADVVSVAARKA